MALAVSQPVTVVTERSLDLFDRAPSPRELPRIAPPLGGAVEPLFERPADSSLRSRLRSLGQETRDASDAISALQLRDSTHAEQLHLLERLHDLASQSAAPLSTAEDRRLLGQEASDLGAQLGELQTEWAEGRQELGPAAPLASPLDALLARTAAQIDLTRDASSAWRSLRAIDSAVAALTAEQSQTAEEQEAEAKLDELRATRKKLLSVDRPLADSEGAKALVFSTANDLLANAEVAVRVQTDRLPSLAPAEFFTIVTR